MFRNAEDKVGFRSNRPVLLFCSLAKFLHTPGGWQLHTFHKAFLGLSWKTNSARRKGTIFAGQGWERWEKARSQKL
jgi:hypothetical protein